MSNIATDRAAAVIHVTALVSVGFDSPDTSRLAAHYQDVLGFVTREVVDGTVYLTLGAEHHCVKIAAGEQKGRTSVGFAIAESLPEAQERLEAAGVTVKHRSDPEPGVREALQILEPTGTPLLLFETQDVGAFSGELSHEAPVALGHVAHFTDDIPRDQRFYLETLGFRWSDSLGQMFTFLRCSQEHHAVNFLTQPGASGMHHIAYKMRDLMHLRSALDRLGSLGCRLAWGPGRHGPGHNIFTYHLDPDGNSIELFTELDVIADERTGRFEPRPWHEDTPQYPKVWQLTPAAANSWGPLSPEMLAQRPPH